MIQLRLPRTLIITFQGNYVQVKYYLSSCQAQLLISYDFLNVLNVFAQSSKLFWNMRVSERGVLANKKSNNWESLKSYFKIESCSSHWIVRIFSYKAITCPIVLNLNYHFRCFMLALLSVLYVWCWNNVVFSCYFSGILFKTLIDF